MAALGPQFPNFKEGDVTYKGIHLQQTSPGRSNRGVAAQYSAQVQRVDASGKRTHATVSGPLRRVHKELSDFMARGYKPHESGYLELREDLD